MMDLLRDTLDWSYAELMHIVRMMYWVWVPGFLLSAFLSHRYRAQAWEGLLARGKRGFASAIFRASWYGVTASPRPRSTLEDADRLLEAGVSPASAMATLVASRNLPPYLLALLTLHLGIEFAVGHVLGTLAMAAMVYVGVSTLSPRPAWTDARGRTAQAVSGGDRWKPASWRALLLSRRGWARALHYGWVELLWFWPGLVLGILLGGFVLAAGLTKWWIELADVGGGRVASDVMNAVLGPSLSALLSLPPVGNLPLGTALFKTDTLAYPGLVGFFLASSFRVSDIPEHQRRWGTKAAAGVALVFYGAAALASLVPLGVFALFAFRPGHIPLFNEVVEEIIRWVPFAVPAGGMGR